jgi:hypothetical protein
MLIWDNFMGNHCNKGDENSPASAIKRCQISDGSICVKQNEDGSIEDPRS